MRKPEYSDCEDEYGNINMECYMTAMGDYADDQRDLELERKWEKEMMQNEISTMKLMGSDVLILELAGKDIFGIGTSGMSTKAKVINTAPDVTSVNIGDTVILSKWEGKELGKYRLVNENDILMKEI